MDFCLSLRVRDPSRINSNRLADLSRADDSYTRISVRNYA